MSEGKRSSFVVRAIQDSRGEVSGTVERVATGTEEAFTGMEALDRAILQMLQGESARPGTGARVQPVSGESPVEGGVGQAPVRGEP